MTDLFSPDIRGLAVEVIAELAARGETVATAESLSAGLCCAALTTVPGSSAVVRGGLIVYATDLKHSLASVPHDVLDAHGPVSEPTARALAAGARAQTSATWGIGLTGVAGPAGQDGHPVGTVFVAVTSAAQTRAIELSCAGGRDDIRCQAVAGALKLLLVTLRN